MMKLEDFSKEVIPSGKLNMITGGERDTPGGQNFFGYGVAYADCDPGGGGDWTYWFDDGRSLVAGPPAGNP